MSIANYLHQAPWFLPVRVVLSFLYGGLIWLRNCMYDFGLFKTQSVKTPIISVGNISSGGSGKTVLVQALVEHFLSLQKKPAVLSRGYGRVSKGLVLVADESGLKGTLSTSGDEPFLIAKNYPGVSVVVSENRYRGAQYLQDTFAPDVIILDDGFQHRSLHRDLDILIIDFQMSSKKHLLPWGFLRESIRNISRADILLFSKNGLHNATRNNLVFVHNNYVRDHLENRIPLDTLKGDYGLFAGLGNPQHFFMEMESLHYPASVKIALPDHAQYSALQRGEITRHSCDYWITTQKDFIKLGADFCKEQQIYFIEVKTSLPRALSDHLKQHFN
ncbi:MAG: tetraacyldisaccharide 4'-kinase [Candidatus Marinimicrobia bacterium]|nr:tetraacyldisaccharide 4'-kinase [Candidatus Neomarinimicrobiota bacterium]MCF7922745.1 tetraacyldisaccharide 4'-kinase [Candidatus Neomarinimicrobiota bacterium]